MIVVDNASQDETPALLRDLAQRANRDCASSSTPTTGASRRRTTRARRSRAAAFLLLNNDTVVHGAWLRNLIGHLRRPAHLGLVGPVTNAIGNEAKIRRRLRRPGQNAGVRGDGLRCDAGVLPKPHARDVLRRRAARDIAGRRTARRALRLGMFEDDDYEHRVRAAGFEVALAWDSFVHHWQRASFKLLGDDEYLRIYRENQAQFATKWSAATPPARCRWRPCNAALRALAGRWIFAPSVGWAIPLAQRPHHLARELARDGYVVVFDCTNAADDVDTLREIEPRLFLYKGPSSALAGLPRITLWTFSYNYGLSATPFPGDVAGHLRLDRRPVGVSLRPEKTGGDARPGAPRGGRRRFGGPPAP